MSDSNPIPPREYGAIDPPPLLRTWARVYAAIAGYLALLIALFTLFTRSLNR
jgi:hypothetical protein